MHSIPISNAVQMVVQKVIYFYTPSKWLENDLRFIDPLENNGRPIKLIDFYSAKRQQLIRLRNYTVQSVGNCTPITFFSSCKQVTTFITGGSEKEKVRQSVCYFSRLYVLWCPIVLLEHLSRNYTLQAFHSARQGSGFCFSLGFLSCSSSSKRVSHLFSMEGGGGIRERINDSQR